MSYKFDFAVTPINAFVRKRVRITFTDETSAEYIVIGFTSGFDNDNGIVSIEVKKNLQDECTAVIYENEIKEIVFI